jgi:hypothetical protein
VKHLVRLALAGALLASAGTAWAGEVKLSFSNGRVSLLATDASPREILGEWARLGQVRVTNLDRLGGSPVTLQFTNVPEAKALETILRGTAGYIAAPRRELTPALSHYDRILLMPGVAPAVPTAAELAQSSNAGATRGRPGQARFGASDGSGDGSAGYQAPWGMNIARPGSNRPPTQDVGHQTYVVTESMGIITARQQATPLPTSSQVPGVAVGQPSSPTTGAARPGEATALPGKRLPGQPPTPVGPIKNPE